MALVTSPACWERNVFVFLPHVIPRASLWLVVLAVCLLNGIWIAMSPQFSMSWNGIATLAGFGVLALFFLVVRSVRHATFDRFLDCAYCVAMFLIFAAFIRLGLKTFNYLVLTYPQPLMDDVLLSWDQALGFDWNAYAAWIAAHAWLRDVLAVVYTDGSIVALLAIVVTAVLLRRRDRVDELGFLLLISGLLCILVAPLFPAEAAWQTVASSHVKAMLGPEVWPEWRGHFQAIRSGEHVVFGTFRPMGLVTFPSYHTCMGLTVIWCSRGHPLALAAGGLAGFGVIAATPVFGGHYFVDLLGGAAVMLVTVLLWHRRWRLFGPPARLLGTAGKA